MHTSLTERKARDPVIQLAYADGSVLPGYSTGFGELWITGRDPANADPSEGVSFGERASGDAVRVGEGEDGRREQRGDKTEGVEEGAVDFVRKDSYWGLVGGGE